MSEQTWAAVDKYVMEMFHPHDEVLDYALAKSQESELPEISVSPAHGKMLMLLAKSVRARTILEIGTLGGYSTIWLARALPADGKLVTLEFEPKHKDVAAKNLQHAGFDSKVEIILGAAVENLPKLAGDSRTPFDFIFIDADKESYSEYLEWSLKLSRSGTLIVADNVVRNGAVIEPDHEDTRVQGIRKFNDLLASEKRVESTVIQTVGNKGYDGFALIYVL
jgi:predicted O-methyltransferase YrrM